MLNRKIVQIEKIISNGYALAHYNNKVVFIKRAIPGETVSFEIIKQKKNYDIALIEDILISSPNRVKPQCEYYTNCGGCDFLHIDYYEHENIKVNILKELLYKNANIIFNNIKFIPSIKFNYRNKVKLHYNKVLGFKKKKSDSIVKIDKCLLLNEKINNILNILSKIKLPDSVYSVEIRTSTENQTMLSIYSRTNIKNNIIGLLKYDIDNIILICNKRTEYIKGKGYIDDIYEGIHFIYTYNNFMQTNSFITLKMIKYLKEKIIKGKNLLDLYSGIGLFSHIFSIYFDNVYSVEASVNSVSLNRTNANENKLKNIKTIKRIIDKTFKPSINFDVVIADPPRSGIDKTFLTHILKKHIKQFIYISCNPGTLTRDLKIFKQYNYNISDITIFDMFPQTLHFETIVILNKE